MKPSVRPSPASIVSRREFMRRTSLGAAALAAAPYVRAAELPPPKLGIAIVGLGGYATGMLAPALKLTQNVQITAVVTGSPEKGRQWSQAFGESQGELSQLADEALQEFEAGETRPLDLERDFSSLGSPRLAAKQSFEDTKTLKSSQGT